METKPPRGDTGQATGEFFLDDVAALHKQIGELTEESEALRVVVEEKDKGNAILRAFVAAYDEDAKPQASTYATRQAVRVARGRINE